MDKKLKAIENLIIEDTAKYYENHDGMFNKRLLRARTSIVSSLFEILFKILKIFFEILFPSRFEWRPNSYLKRHGI